MLVPFLSRSAGACRRGLRTGDAGACRTRLRTRSVIACLEISRGEHAIYCPLVTNQWAYNSRVISQVHMECILLIWLVYNIEIWPLILKQCVLFLKSEGRYFLLVFTFKNLIYSFILTIMSDTDTDSYCAICVTNNGDIANVDKDFDLSDISVSSEGTVDLTDFDSLSESDNNNGDVDVHVDDNNHAFRNVLKPVVLKYVFVQFFIIIWYHTDL